MDNEITRMSAAGYEYINADQNNLHELVRGTRVGHRIVEVHISSDGLGIWVKTRDMTQHPTRTGTCRHARQIQERWTGDIASGQITSHVELPESYTCGWLDQFQLPPAVSRWAHGLEIRSGDCESCPMYQAPDVPAVLEIGKV